MSLTYPILNDIMISKLETIKASLLELKEETLDQNNDTNTNIDKLEEKINTQNVKTDLIHSLFKHVQSNTNHTMTQKELDNVKISNTNIIHSIKSEQEKLFKAIQRNSEETNKQFSKSIDMKFNRFQNYINNNELAHKENERKINSTLYKIQGTTQIHIDKINTRISQLNLRIDGLEEKYVTLQKNMHSKLKVSQQADHLLNEKGGMFDVLQNNSESESGSDSNDDYNGPNWVKVTKKH